jgi:hypothetical protein
MAKPLVSPKLLKAISTAVAVEPEGAGKRKEANPVKHRKTERELIRPARTAIAHTRGGNKGK